MLSMKYRLSIEQATSRGHYYVAVSTITFTACNIFIFYGFASMHEMVDVGLRSQNIACLILPDTFKQND